MSVDDSGPKPPKKNKKAPKSSHEDIKLPPPETGSSSSTAQGIGSKGLAGSAKKNRWTDHPTFGFDLQSVVLKQLQGESNLEPGSPNANENAPEDIRIAHDRPPHAKRSQLRGRCAVIFSLEALEPWAHHHLRPWMLHRIRLKKNDWTLWTLEQGPLWVLLMDFQSPLRHQADAPSAPLAPKISAGQSTPPESSFYGLGREMGAVLLAHIQEYALMDLSFEWVGHEALPKAQVQGYLDGMFVGLEMGSYRFKNSFQGPLPPLPRLSLPDRPKWDPSEALQTAVATNLARHLVNLPPNLLYPESYGEMIQGLFSESRQTSVEIWDHRRLQKERCHLICAVGGASQYGPTLVHLRYRPLEPKTQRREAAGKGSSPSSPSTPPVVFVAKGITFDSGGLNIKDSGGMRLMKKDMGGSASALAIAYWLDRSGLQIPCDFYLALAENAIGSKSFRPGDIITSRSGITVEIDNTDAEGRLVLADAIDVALEHHPQMKLLINFATLTGAMRVALGTKVAGYFTTVPETVLSLEKAALQTGEPLWQMPLYPEYRGHLKSHVADLANSGPQRFGGAISAALFLQRFVGAHPWLHIDHFAWNEGAGAGANEPGGSGQLVQLFAHYLKELAASSASGPAGKS